MAEESRLATVVSEETLLKAVELFGLDFNPETGIAYAPCLGCGKVCEYFNDEVVRRNLCLTEKSKDCIGYLLVNEKGGQKNAK